MSALSQLKNSKISVIMACYNSSDFLKRSVESVLNQTYQNWELLCVNDMSTDNTLEILNQYAQKDSRIKVFDKKVRGGCAAPNFNYAIERATGDFMCLIGHDDAFSSDLLEQEIKRQQETNADIIIPDCYFVYPEDEQKNWTMAGIVNTFGKTNSKINKKIILSGRKAVELSVNWHIQAFNLIRADIMRKYKYCEEGMNGDEYSARVFYLFANKVVFSEGTYFYYQIDSSITKKMTSKRWDVYMMPYLLEKLLIEHHFSYALIKFMEDYRQRLYDSLLELYAKNKEELSMEEQVSIGSHLAKNKKLLEELNISKLGLKQNYWNKLFLMKTDGYKKSLIIFGIIKIHYKA